MMNRDMINSMKHGPAAWTVLHCTLSKDAIYYNDIMLPPVRQQTLVRVDGELFAKLFIVTILQAL